MTADSQHYESILRILQEAGFLFSVRDENAEVVNGNITIANPNLVAKNCEGDKIEATADDVAVYYNGEKLGVKEVRAEEGVIVLEDCPEDTQNVSVFYKYTNVELDFVKVVRDDVENAIKTKLQSLGSCSRLKSTEIVNQLRMITRFWAAGSLLAREYGYNTDSEQTSKDGYRKMQEAKEMLDGLYNELLLTCGNSDVNGGADNVISDSEGSLFDRPRREPRGDSDW